METLDINSGMKANKGLGCTALIATLLTFGNQWDAKADLITSDIRYNVEQAHSKDILSNILQRTGKNLPSGYEKKARDFVNKCDLLKYDEIAKFTEDFIVKNISDNPGINEENRNLFVINLCFEYLLGEDVYEGDDGNDERTQEFKKVVPVLCNILEEYINEASQRIVILIYMKKNDLQDYYDRNPKMVNQKNDKAEELKKLISLCEQLDIDYEERLSSLQGLYNL